MKIVIIGHSGAGKSTLAKILSEYYKIPCLYMDTVQFYGDFSSRSLKEQEELAQKFLDENDKWVIDGNYYRIAQRRFSECDEIYYLDFNRFFCYFSALKRYLKNRNRYRESLGAYEHFDLDFQGWILYGGRKKDYLDSHLKHMALCKGAKHHFKSRRELIAYLRKNKIIKN